MPPLPASAPTGGSTPTPSPSNETGESETFTDNADDEPRVRGTNDTSVPIKPDPVIIADAEADADADYASTIDLMPEVGKSTPPPSGKPGDGDDGATPTKPHFQQQIMYTDADIGLVHEIISTAEVFLASIPERDRNPAEALYAAADEVLPRKGFVSEDVPSVSRLLFRIGAQRGPESLLDKFKAILSVHNIEIELTESELPSVEPLPLYEDSDTTEDVQTPRAPSAAYHAPPAERAGLGSPSHSSRAPPDRRYSDSSATDLDVNELRRGNGSARQPAAAESVVRPASTDRFVSQKKEVRFSDVVDSQSLSDLSWDQEASDASLSANLPLHLRTAVPEGQFQRPAGMQSAGTQRDDARPSTRAENRPPSDFSSFGQSRQAPSSHLTDQSRSETRHPAEDFSSVSFDLAGLREAENAERPRLSGPPPRQLTEGPLDSGDSDNDSDDHGDSDNDHPRHDNAPSKLPSRGAGDEHAMPQEPPEREMTAKEARFVEHLLIASSLDHWRDISRDTRRHNIRAEAHAEKWDAWETIGEALEIWIQSALTMRIDENDGIRAYQDHLRQRNLERSPVSPPKRVEDLGVSASGVNQRLKQSIERAREPLVSAVGQRVSGRPNLEGSRRQHSQSVERSLVEETFNRTTPQTGAGESQLGRSQPVVAQDQPAVAAGYDYDNIYDASEELESEDSDRNEFASHSQYQVAAAAWNYFLLSKAFTHWADCADEEVERTQIARRHILRKKCYQAWVRDTDETEAESKAIWFTQMSTIKQWRATAISAARRSVALGRIAAGLEAVDKTEEFLFEWYHASKERLSERMDEHYLINGCLEDWYAQKTWLGSAQVEADGLFQGSMLVRFVQYWQGEAEVQRRAEAGAGPVIARRDEFLRSGLSLAWRQEAEAARTREKTAVAYELRDFTKHWIYEGKVVALRKRETSAELDGACYHWYLEWRLKLAEHMLVQQEKTRLLEKWVGASAAAAARSYHLRHLAQDVRYHDTITGCFNTALEALEHIEEQAYYARNMVVERLVPKVLKNWKAKVSHHRRLERWSYLSNLLYIGQEIIPEWQAVRRQQYQQRMWKLYSDYRYKVHSAMAKDSLDLWRGATAHAVTKSWEADDMCIEDDAALVLSIIRTWRSKLEFVAFTSQVAEEADMESYLMQWTAMHEAHGEAQLDGFEMNFAQTAGGVWDEWTLAFIALRGREQTVREFRGHNARRDVRHFFTAWVGITEAVGDRVPEMDFRTTRRGGAGGGGSRWGTPASAVARTAAARLVRSTGSVHPVGQHVTVATSSSNNNDSNLHSNVKKNVMTPLVFRTPARPNLLFRGSFRQSSTTPAYQPPSDLTFEERDEMEGDVMEGENGGV